MRLFSLILLSSIFLNDGAFAVIMPKDVLKNRQAEKLSRDGASSSLRGSDTNKVDAFKEDKEAAKRRLANKGHRRVEPRNLEREYFEPRTIDGQEVITVRAYDTWDPRSSSSDEEYARSSSDEESARSSSSDEEYARSSSYEESARSSSSDEEYARSSSDEESARSSSSDEESGRTYTLGVTDWDARDFEDLEERDIDSLVEEAAFREFVEEERQARSSSDEETVGGYDDFEARDIEAAFEGRDYSELTARDFKALAEDMAIREYLAEDRQSSDEESVGGLESRENKKLIEELAIREFLEEEEARGMDGWDLNARSSGSSDEETALGYDDIDGREDYIYSREDYRDEELAVREYMDEVKNRKWDEDNWRARSSSSDEESARSSSSDEERAFAFDTSDEESARSSSDEEFARSSSDEEYARSSSDEESARSSSDEESARSSSYEESARSSSDEENALSSSDFESARSSSDEEFALSSSDEEFARSSSDEEYARSSSDEEYPHWSSSDEESAYDGYEERGYARSSSDEEYPHWSSSDEESAYDGYEERGFFDNFKKKSRGKTKKTRANRRNSIRFCIDTNVRGAKDEGTESKFSINLINSKGKSFGQKETDMPEDKIGCYEFSASKPENVSRVDIHFPGNDHMLINRVLLYANRKIVQKWGHRTDGKGFCMSTKKALKNDTSGVKGSNWTEHIYASMCDEEVQFYSDGRINGSVNGWINSTGVSSAWTASAFVGIASSILCTLFI